MHRFRSSPSRGRSDPAPVTKEEIMRAIDQYAERHNGKGKHGKTTLFLLFSTSYGNLPCRNSKLVWHIPFGKIFLCLPVVVHDSVDLAAPHCQAFLPVGQKSPAKMASIYMIQSTLINIMNMDFSMFSNPEYSLSSMIFLKAIHFLYILPH